MTTLEAAGWLLTENYNRTLEEGGQPMSGSKLHKLLYYAQAVHLSYCGELLFPEDMQRWKYGPVCVPVYNTLQEMRQIKGQILVWPICRHEPDQECKDTLFSVFETFGGYEAWKLSKMVLAELDEIGCSEGDNIDYKAAAAYFTQHYTCETT